MLYEGLDTIKEEVLIQMAFHYQPVHDATSKVWAALKKETENEAWYQTIKLWTIHGRCL